MGFVSFRRMVKEQMNNPKDKRMNSEEEYAAEIDYRNDSDEESPVEYTEEYDWSRHDFDNDPDWR